MSVEKRRYRRIKENVLVRFRLEDEEVFQFGLCLDLSQGGMKLLSDRGHLPGCRLIIYGHFSSGDEVFHISAVGRVVWEEATFEGKAVMGIEFLEISKEDFESLKRYIEKQALALAG